MVPELPVSNVHRMALYYAPPPDSAFARAGSTWLGRCAYTGNVLRQPDLPDVTPQMLRACTSSPRRYGWHATIRAPFHLAPGHHPEEVWHAVAALCRSWPAFALPPLRVRPLRSFLALRPRAGCPPLQGFAAAAVRALHGLAAAPDPHSANERWLSAENARQRAYLHAWGYPYVFSEFRFHFTLTNRLDDAPAQCRAALVAAARRWFGGLPRLQFDRVALFVEPAPGADFRLWTYLPLGDAT